MKEKDFFEEKVKECSEIKYEINEEYKKVQFSSILKVAKGILHIKPKSFNFIHNMLFYKNGYPKPESKSKLYDFLDKFSDLMLYYTFLGKDQEIINYLDRKGIDVKLLVAMANSSIPSDWEQHKSAQKTFIAWKNIYLNKDVYDFNSKSELLLDLFEKSAEIQKNICELNDEIKIDNAETVEFKCEVKKPNFLKAVILKYKERVNKKKGKDNKEEIKKLENDIKELKEVIEMF